MLNDFLAAVPSHLNWGTGWGLGVLCMLILRLTQINHPGTTGHTYKTLVDKHYDAHPTLRHAPKAWRTANWFVQVLRDMILWPIFFPVEVARCALMWHVRIQKRKAGKRWLHPKIRQLSRRLMRNPENYRQLCVEAGVPRLATAITFAVEHPERIPDYNTFVHDSDSDSPFAQLTEMVSGLPADPWEYPYLTGGYLRFREEMELWPGYSGRIAAVAGELRKRSINKAPWGCAEVFSNYAVGLAEGWLLSESYDKIVDFLANLVDADQAARETAMAELMDGIGVVSDDLYNTEMHKARTWPEQFRLYDKFGKMAQPTTPRLPVKPETAGQMTEGA